MSDNARSYVKKNILESYTKSAAHNFSLLNHGDKKEQAVIYSLIFILFLTAGNAGIIELYGVSPLLMAIFIGLCYCRCSLAFICPIYILCAVILNPTLENLVVSLFVVSTIFISYFIHLKIKQGIGLLEMNTLNILGISMAVALSDAGIKDICIMYSAAIITVNCAVIAAKAVLIRGLNYKMTIDELVSVLTIMILIFMGIYKIDVLGIYPFYIIIGFFSLAILDVYGLKQALIMAAVGGFSATFLSGNIGFPALFIGSILIASIFIKSSVSISAVAYMLATVAITFIYKFLPQDANLVYLYTAFGICVYVALPKKAKSYLKKYSIREVDNNGRGVINRNRYELYNKLNKVSKAFLNISAGIKGSISRKLSVEEKINDISELMERELCSNCIMLDDCLRKCGSPKEQFRSIVIGAHERGEATVLEISNHLAYNCHNVNQAMALATKLTTSYKNSLEDMDMLSSSKMLIAEHAREVSALIGRIAENINGSVTYNTGMENHIIETLCHNNIVCNEAMAYTDKSGLLRVQLTIRSIDIEKKELPILVSRIAKRKMVINDVEEAIYNGLISAELIAAPKYELIYATTIMAKSGNKVSGDTKSVRKIGEDKALVALSDGMGNGMEAEKYSNVAISLIESFYEAGFQDATATALCNRLLALNNEDNYSAMDICLIDLRSGKADFIKLGAPKSYLMQGHNIEEIENTSLPIGILEDVYPVSSTRTLYDKDIILWVSDGVYDTLGDNAIRRILTCNKGLNPQGICDAIAYEMKPLLKDDSSCICVRIIGKNL